MGKAQNEWNRENVKRITIHLMGKGDADVIAWWDAQPRKADAFRRMVRQQMQTEEAVRWLRENPEKN